MTFNIEKAPFAVTVVIGTAMIFAWVCILRLFALVVQVAPGAVLGAGLFAFVAMVCSAITEKTHGNTPCP